jgi:hypothetical protein
VIPIVASMLVGLAAKAGLGLVATAAKKLFASGPPASGPATSSPQGTASFAEELDRARPAASSGVAATAPVARSTGAALRTLDAATVRPTVEAPRLTTDPSRLTISTRSGRHRTGPWAHRFGRHALGVYRRPDLGAR